MRTTQLFSVSFSIKAFAALSIILALTAGKVRTAETESMTVGTGKAQFNGLLQAWTINDTGGIGPKLNFRIRRAELKFNGSVVPDTRWFVMLDPSKSLTTGAVASTNDNKPLQDIGVAFSITHELEIISGQFKIPTTAEGLDSSGELMFPERAYVARKYGDKREPGAMLTYKESNWKATAMISNGQSTNTDDINNKKDLHARLDFSPTKEIKLGAFTTAGDFNYGTKGRWGLNGRLFISDLTVELEGVKANDVGTSSTGWSVDGGYRVTDHFQPVARFDSFNNGGTFTSSNISLGLNYFLSKHNSKIQAAYGILKNMSGSNGSYVPANGTNATLFTLSFQSFI